MSTLLNLSVPVQERIIKVPGGEGFAVRGLNPINLVAIYKRHMGELEPMFQRVMGLIAAKGGLDAEDIQASLIALVAESPVLLGELIVIASGGDPADAEIVTIIDPASREPTSLPKFDAALLIAMALPFTVQVDALAAIGTLTFSQDMPPGKFFALVLKLLGAVTGAFQGWEDFLARAQTGSGESVGASIS